MDPVKAQESATPRGSSSKKHSRDTTFDGENRLSKRPKSDDDEIFSGPTSPISVIPSYQEVAVQDRIPSPETRHEPAMNAEPYRTVAVPHMGAVEPVAETKPTLNSTIRLEPVHNLMDGIGANVESAGHLMKGRTQQFTSPPDSVRQNDIITQGHEGQTVGGQNLQRKDSVDLPGTIEDEVQLVETKPSPPALVGHSEPSVTSNENSESVELVRQDTIVPKPTFEASKAPVQGAMQSIEHDKNPVTQSLQNSTGDHPTEQGRQAIASLSEQQNSSAEPHLQDVTTFSPPLTPIQNRLKSEPMTSLLSRRSSRQPKEIQRFSTEQSNGIQAPEKARRPSSNTPTVQTNGVSWSPELQPRRRSSTKKTPSRPNGSITKTSKNATTQRTNGVNNPITDGPRKSAGCEAKQNGRASTSEASVEEDEDMRLARELAEMEFGLRRRGGR